VTSGVPLNWYAVVLVVAAVASWALTFPVRRVATAIGYVAQPDERKVHTTITPEAGGVAMFLAMLVAVGVAACIPALDLLFQGPSTEALGLVLGAAAIFIVGLIDDFRDMSAPAKMAGQVLAASILYFLGDSWFQFKVPLAGFVVLSPDVIPLLTALWVIAITNAVNLIDGLDGLAAGVVAIASGALAVYGLHLQNQGNLDLDNIGPLIAVVTCGICVGFLPHNFHPARIFMGDAGAMVLGLLMAASTMLIGGAPGGTVQSGEACPSSTWPSPSCGGRPTGPGSPPRTRTTSTTGCCAWATGTGGACSSCGCGRPSSRGSCCSPCTSPASTSSSPSGWRPSA
jgi:UDP-GlcNAc:undecaprenyl-phosphate GlcNAc-1-phosphate transferase